MFFVSGEGKSRDSGRGQLKNDDAREGECAKKYRDNSKVKCFNRNRY